MTRTAAEHGKYPALLDDRGLLAVLFPLRSFTMKILAHKESWTLGALVNLFRLNLVLHIEMAEHRGWFVYPLYRIILRRAPAKKEKVRQLQRKR